jgi:threonine dehydratase
MLRCQENTRRRGGAVGLAALYYNKLQDLGGKKVVAVISGGNIDMKLLSRIVRRGLEHDGRLCELSVIVQDKPGSVASLATVIAGQGANIYELSQRRRESEVALGERAVVLQLETREHEHIAAIVEELRREGIRVLSAWKGARDHHSRNK